MRISNLGYVAIFSNAECLYRELHALFSEGVYTPLVCKSSAADLGILNAYRSLVVLGVLQPGESIFSPKSHEVT